MALDEIGTEQLARRFGALATGLKTLQADSPCPWALAVIVNQLLRQAKRELSTDPVARHIRLLEEDLSDNGTPVANQTIGTVMIFADQLSVALQES